MVVGAGDDMFFVAEEMFFHEVPAQDAGKEGRGRGEEEKSEGVERNVLLEGPEDEKLLDGEAVKVNAVGKVAVFGKAMDCEPGLEGEEEEEVRATGGHEEAIAEAGSKMGKRRASGR